MRTIFLFILLTIFGINSFGQKMSGFGGELSVLGLKPNLRMWISKTTGFEVFGGVSAELGDFKPNDFEGGLKYLHTFLYNLTDRTYFGLMSKWEWINVEAHKNENINLPVVGVLIGKEWFNKNKKIKGFAIELGYQYGVKKYGQQINLMSVSKERYEEFPLVLNLRYSFYKKK